MSRSGNQAFVAGEGEGWWGAMTSLKTTAGEARFLPESGKHRTPKNRNKKQKPGIIIIASNYRK